jgi:hypothetical protein
MPVAPKSAGHVLVTQIPRATLAKATALAGRRWGKSH